jgi:ATP-dependent Clp protease ATP-binding subunit ClpA
MYVREIVDKFIGRLNARLDDQDLRLMVDESVYALLMKEGYSPEYGCASDQTRSRVADCSTFSKGDS